MDLTTFAMEAVTDFRTVGAVAPSSRYLAQAMLEPLSLEKARHVLELGPGTGVMTQALLNLIPSDAVLFAFEINPRFLSYLRRNVRDPRLHVVNARAEMILKELDRRGCQHIDAAVSSLALSLMPVRQRIIFLRGIGRLLGKEGVFTQYQYFHGLQVKNGQLKRFDLERLLRRHFGSVERKMIFRNLPPAFVFACRKASLSEIHH